MTSSISLPSPPRGFQSIFYRAPIIIYRLGLGGLLKNRFLLLTHIGRISGKDRQAVLEIIHSDPTSDTFTVVSGFGKKSDWYQNIMQESAVTIQVGNRTMAARADQLDPDSAEQIFLHYVENNPASIKMLSKLVGYELDHTLESYINFSRQIPIIQFSTQEQSKY